MANEKRPRKILIDPQTDTTKNMHTPAGGLYSNNNWMSIELRQHLTAATISSAFQY